MTSMALSTNRYYALVVPGITGFILALAVLAVATACRQHCGERRRRRLAVKQQQQLLLTKVHVDKSHENTTATSYLDQHLIPRSNAMSSRQEDGVSSSWISNRVSDIYARVVLNGTDVGECSHTMNSVDDVARSMHHSPADCTVDVVTRRAACQPLPVPPQTTDRWRCSGRPPKTSTPRTLRRVTTEAALWTISSTPTSKPTSMTISGNDYNIRLWQRGRNDHVARQLSTSVPLLLETSYSGGMTSSCRYAQQDSGFRIRNDDNLLLTDEQKYLGSRRTSLDYLRPITVDGVTTFPVCPRAIAMVSVDCQHHQLRTMCHLCV